ncbi:hypothetical protein HT031_003451 [Scenedesmus sp. PABB004]|nr:hypothetical protein HT031_003451 [Scenedesmus sp. PABB004]
MTTAKVQISVSLLEKLAGIRKEPARGPHAGQHRAPPGLQQLAFGPPLLGHPPHHHGGGGPGGGGAADGSALRASLAQSQRVGALLLKAEAEELAAVQARAQELVNAYSTTTQPALSCGAERQAVLDCYAQQPGGALQCAALVDAYAACARGAAGRLMS